MSVIITEKNSYKKECEKMEFNTRRLQNEIKEYQTKF